VTENQNFENRLIFQDVIDMTRLSCFFFDSQCIHPTTCDPPQFFSINYHTGKSNLLLSPYVTH